MRESKIEQYLKEQVEAAGGECRKFVSPGRRGVPDQLVLMGLDRAAEKLRDFLWLYDIDGLEDELLQETVRIIVAEVIRMVEVKQEGVEPSGSQLREHARLRALGITVDVLASRAAVDMYVRLRK